MLIYSTLYKKNIRTEYMVHEKISPKGYQTHNLPSLCNMPKTSHKLCLASLVHIIHYFCVISFQKRKTSRLSSSYLCFLFGILLQSLDLCCYFRLLHFYYFPINQFNFNFLHSNFNFQHSISTSSIVWDKLTSTLPIKIKKFVLVCH